MANNITAEVAFAIISAKLEAALKPQGFEKQTVSNSDEDELVALFTGESVAYTLVYFFDKKHVVLRSCEMADDGPDNEWKTLSTWMFDPKVDTEREVNSIAGDFCDTVGAPVRTKAVAKTNKKKKKNTENNADPLFFSKRFINIFPEIRDEIKTEENSYETFRGVTFAETSIVPRVNALLGTKNPADISKLAGILSAQYGNGDADTRSIITIIILNSIDSKDKEDLIFDKLSPELQKAFESSRKLKGKKFKPEKPKKKKQSFMSKMMAESGGLDNK